MKKIALLFPGQGSQYIGMGKSLYEDYEIARKTFEEGNHALGYDLQKICFEGNLGELSKIENMLPAILTTSVAAFRVFMQQLGVAPVMLAGHSLGEYSALVCSGVMDFQDALKIVRLRSLLAQEIADKEHGTMTIVENINVDAIDSVCQRIRMDGSQASVACYNSSSQAAISGVQNAVMKVEDQLAAMGANITPLMLGVPFHNSLMESATEKLADELNKCEQKAFQWPVISNVTALPYESEKDVVDKLLLQLIKPVQWKKTLDYLEENKIDMAIEIGPQSILKSFLRDEHRSFDIYSFNNKSDQELLQKLLAADMRSNHISVVTKCLAAAVSTKNQNWDPGEYEEGALKPYAKIQEIQDRLDQTGEKPTYQEMKTALDMLYKIMKTKKVSNDEQMKRFNRIFGQTGTMSLFSEFVKRNGSQNE